MISRHSQIVDLGTDKRTDKSRVDLTVLGGLVTVATNKTQLPDGSSSGPVIVTVFGIPVYVGSGTSRPKPPRVPRPPKNPRPEASPLLPEIKDKSARFEKELTNRAEAKLEQKEKSKMAELLAQMSKKLDEQSETIRQLQAGRATSSESQVERSTSTTKKLSDNRPSTGKLDATTTPKPIRFEDVTDILRRRRDEMSS